jgi:hypothetical protein
MIYNFTPNEASIPYKFQPTLDGVSYSAEIWWNVQGQRCYITVSDLQANVIFSLALIDSPIDYPISMTGAFFKSTLTYHSSNKTIVVTP